MQVSVKTKEFKEAMKIIMAVIPKKATHPALAGCRVSLERNGIQLSATDWETSVSLLVPFSDKQSKQQGSVIVSAKRLADAIGRCKEDTIICDINKDALSFPKAKLKSFISDGDFPEFPRIPSKGSKKYTLKDTWNSSVKFVTVALANQDMRFALTGIYLDFKSGRMVCSDGKRMHLASLCDKINIPGLVIAAKILKKINPTHISIPPAEGKTKAKKITQVFFHLPNGLCTVRILEGGFPNPEEYIPKKRKTSIVVDKKEMLSATKEIKHVANNADQEYACRFTIDKSLDMLIEYEDDEGAVEYLETVPGTVKGKKSSLLFDTHFLYDAIATMKPGGNVYIFMQGKINTPVLIKDGNECLAIVMPKT